jgi:hypothetical protein
MSLGIAKPAAASALVAVIVVIAAAACRAPIRVAVVIPPSAA